MTRQRGRPSEAAIARRAAALSTQPITRLRRARLGSPLEDVSSWLESLGFREAEARRRHDTLLRRYLTARGLARRLDRGLRDAYWLAAAGNVFAGALRYHLAVARGWREAGAWKRAGAVRAALDDLCVVRRADAVWRG